MVGVTYVSLGYSLGKLRVSSITSINSFSSSLNNLYSPDEVIKRYSTGLLLHTEGGVGLERRLSFPGALCFLGFSTGYQVSQRAAWRTNAANYFLANSPVFSTNGWLVEIKFRYEYDPSTAPDAIQEPRGLFKFFQ